MNSFSYIAEDKGQEVKGKLSADSEALAIARLEGMGMNVLKIGEAGADMKDVGTPEGLQALPSPPPAPRPPPVQTSIAFGGDDDEEEPDDGYFDEVPLEPRPPLERPPVVAGLVDEAPSTFGSAEFPAIATREKPPPEDAPESEEEPRKKYVDVIRTETLLYGTHDEISVRAGDLLHRRFGRVTHLQMQPDMRGGIVLALVIEHDVPLKEETN
jgi:hypothetical protein